MTPLEALEKLYGFYDLPYRNEIAYMLEQENLGEYKEIIEKALKALEIIKTLKISVYQTRHNETGCEMCIEDEDGNLIFKTITEQEYDLLKEVLK